MISLTHWKWVTLQMVGHTLISFNKRMSVEEKVFLVFRQTLFSYFMQEKC